jgi:hypothetical protein
MAGPAPTPAPQNYGQTGTTPAGTAPRVVGDNYQWTGNSTGGINYTYNGTPITNTQYQSGTGIDTGKLEAGQLSAWQNVHPDPGHTLPAETGPAAQPSAADLAAKATADYKAGILNSDMLQKGTALDNANTGISRYGAAGGDLDTGIQDLTDAWGSGQKAIDTKSTNNELSRMQGHQGILDMVGNGIQSGGVMLANKNAGDSSGSEALARAYGILGRQQESKVGNQYEQGANSIAAEQGQFDTQRAGQLRDFNTKKTDTINNIIDTAKNTLGVLNASLAGANIADRIDIQNEIQTVKDNAAKMLQTYDAKLQSGYDGVHAQGGDVNRQKANELNIAGTAAPNTFDYTTQAPTVQQGTGPSASPLPLFTLPKNKQTA